MTPVMVAHFLLSGEKFDMNSVYGQYLPIDDCWVKKLYDWPQRWTDSDSIQKRMVCQGVWEPRAAFRLAGT